MLKGLPTVLTPDLLWAIAAMGHGDRLAIVDANYPAHSLHSRTIPLVGVGTVEAVTAIATLVPLDDFTEPSAFRMTPDGEPEAEFDVHRDVQEALSSAEGRPVRLAALERSSFYDVAKQAFAVVATTDQKPFACFLITKGVVRLDDAPSDISETVHAIHDRITQGAKR